MVWRTTRRLLSHEADAADCFQETFVSAMGVAKRQDVRHWPPLLGRIATARALDRLRQNMRRIPTRPITGDIEAVRSGPDQLAELSELSDQLRIALAQLPPRQSEVFCLRFLNDLSYLEISKELEMSIDAVGVALHRARGRLRELLGSCAEQKRSWP